MLRFFPLLIVPVVISCSSSSTKSGDVPSSILYRADLKDALRAIAASPAPAPNTCGAATCAWTASCNATANSFLALANTANVDGYLSESSMIPDITGTWTWSDCFATDSNAYPVESACAGSITWSNQAGGRITQDNAGGVSQGSGAVTFALPDGTTSAYIIQLRA